MCVGAIGDTRDAGDALCGAVVKWIRGRNGSASNYTSDVVGGLCHDVVYEA